MKFINTIFHDLLLTIFVLSVTNCDKKVSIDERKESDENVCLYISKLYQLVPDINYDKFAHEEGKSQIIELSKNLSESQAINCLHELDRNSKKIGKEDFTDYLQGVNKCEDERKERYIRSILFQRIKNHDLLLLTLSEVKHVPLSIDGLPLSLYLYRHGISQEEIVKLHRRTPSNTLKKNIFHMILEEYKKEIDVLRIFPSGLVSELISLEEASSRISTTHNSWKGEKVNKDILI